MNAEGSGHDAAGAQPHYEATSGSAPVEMQHAAEAECSAAVMGATAIKIDNVDTADLAAQAAPPGEGPGISEAVDSKGPSAQVSEALSSLTAVLTPGANATNKPLEIDFGCNALRDCKLETTIEREVLEKQLQVAQTWCKVRSIDNATSTFKMQRLTPITMEYQD